MEDKSESDPDVTPFQFQNTGLSDRCKDVFSSLDALERKHQEFEKSRAKEDADTDKLLIDQTPCTEADNDSTFTFKRPTFSGRDYQSHRSSKGGRHGHEKHDKSHDKLDNNQQFRKPMPPNYVRGRHLSRGRYGRGRNTPDYKIHPERWTEYSLEDVDVSDSANKAAALDFLHERRKLRENSLKEESMDIGVSACSKGQITFKKPTKVKSGNTSQLKSQPMETMMSKSSCVEKMESDIDDDNNTSSSLVIGVLDSASCSDDSASLKRKFASIDIEDEDIEKGSDDAEPVNFKSRKTVKRNFRSKKSADDDSND
ncbi:hypothetical protein ACF0H5_016061 [Mactra antiquata]